VSRFKRLTDAEARQLTRAEILARVEAEQQYWFRGRRIAADPDGYREFSRIMHTYLNPGAMMQDLIDLLEGRGSGGYMSRRPCDDDEAEDPVIAYARRLLRRSEGT
jgi:hypothetical protein